MVMVVVMVEVVIVVVVEEEEKEEEEEEEEVVPDRSTLVSFSCEEKTSTSSAVCSINQQRDRSSNNHLQNQMLNRPHPKCHKSRRNCINSISGSIIAIISTLDACSHQRNLVVDLTPRFWCVCIGSGV